MERRIFTYLNELNVNQKQNVRIYTLYNIHTRRIQTEPTIQNFEKG